VDVPTLNGSTARLRVPKLTQNGQIFRLKGYGMPAVGSSELGHLYAKVDAQLPTALTPQAEEHYAALAKLGAPESTTKAG
jgi:molecular chaperone DnaJ